MRILGLTMETRIRGGDSSKRAEDSTVRAGELQMREAAMVSVKRKSMSTENSASGGSVKGEEQMIRWDRFLPRRFLKVLLVESDDSTRHIVAALLRKCSYQGLFCFSGFDFVMELVAIDEFLVLCGC